MPEYLQLTVDKFTFKIATDRLYSPEGMWVRKEDGRIRVGLSDFFQQRNGDVAFAEIQDERKCPRGKRRPGQDESATIAPGDVSPREFQE